MFPTCSYGNYITIPDLEFYQEVVKCGFSQLLNVKTIDVMNGTW